MALANASGEGRAERMLVWIAFTIVVVTDFGYLLIIRVQDSNAPTHSRCHSWRRFSL
jgi:hypothetical protein